MLKSNDFSDRQFAKYNSSNDSGIFVSVSIAEPERLSFFNPLAVLKSNDSSDWQFVRCNSSNDSGTPVSVPIAEPER